MAKQREETYYAVEADSGPPPARCVVAGCAALVVSELHCDDYAVGLELFCGIRREKVHSRRMGDRRFFACEEHEEYYRRTAGLRWQLLMF